MESTSELKPWNVFLPHHILFEPAGYIMGKICRSAGMLYAFRILQQKKVTPCPLNIIGYWLPDDSVGSVWPESVAGLSEVKLTVSRRDGCADIGDCRLELKSSSGYVMVHPVVCVLFNFQELRSSYVLSHCIQQSSCDKVLQKSVKSSSMGIFINQLEQQQAAHTSPAHTSPAHTSPSHTSPAHILPVNISRPQEFIEPVSADSAHWLTTWMSRLIASTLLCLALVLMWSVCYAGHLLNFWQRIVQKFSFLLPKLLHNVSITQHFQERAACFQRVLKRDRGDRFNLFLLYNSCGQQLMNSCLGVTAVIFLGYLGLTNQIASCIMNWAEDIARQLLCLVQWLMGSPAGLKLNAQLTRFLGHFFIYHIYLWTGYLTLLRTLMPYLLWACSLTGVLGISAQICLAADLLSMLTLHIYCFYVYAAKIFSLQLKVMASLWRLFRGKKWNVLRSRVDSASYNIDQLFFGTLLFTILLFLLPTTSLYYSVFTVLRLLVLVVQGLLSRLVTWITGTPVFTLWSRVFARKLVAGVPVFELDHLPEEGNQNCLVLVLRVSQMPLSELIKLTATLLPEHREYHSWRGVILSLATGRLIYPWIDTTSTQGR